MRENPSFDDEHLDAACAWLNVESSVMQQVAEREFALDELTLAVDIQDRTRRFLVDGFGSDGEAMFNEITGGDLPDNLSEDEYAGELSYRLSQKLDKPSFPLACYLLASKWSIQSILREEGATRETFRGVWEETFRLLRHDLGNETERAWELTTEFMESAHS